MPCSILSLCHNDNFHSGTKTFLKYRVPPSDDPLLLKAHGIKKIPDGINLLPNKLDAPCLLQKLSMG